MPSISASKRFSIQAAMVVTGLGLAFAAGGWVKALGQQALSAPAAYAPELPAYRSMDANLYMQTAAEYRACCYQAYNLATFRLKDALAKKPVGKPAVIVDLDETVLDNAGFQAMQSRSKLAFDPRLWDRWEQKEGDFVAIIPGAKEFILEAKKAGVAVAYISSRSDKNRGQTKLLLDRLEIPASADNLLKLQTDKSSNKTTRRQEVENEYTVLLLVGDNLRDFNEKFAFKFDEKTKLADMDQAISNRKLTVDNDRDAWGDRWIILPNSAYGEWTKPWTKPFDQGVADLDRLTPTLPSK